jgi:hypothetical protein
MTEKTIGIIAAPEFPTEVANQLKEELPEILNERMDEETSWTFETMVDGVTSVAENSEVLLESVLSRQENQNWDYTLCLTDIPIFYEDDLVLARVHFEHNTAFISLSALGWYVRKRITKMAVQLITDIHFDYTNTSNEAQNKRLNSIFSINKIKKLQITENKEIVSRYILQPKLNSLFTLLSGMTYDNQPWKIMPALKSVIAVAFGSGAYGMIFPTLWQLSYEYSSLRLAGLTILAILSLSLWIIQGHNLWEKEALSQNPRYRLLYNVATVSTLFLAVGFFYIILIALFIVAAFILIEPTYYANQMGLASDPTFMNYLQLAWMTASIGTVTGAVGVGLEDEETVRNTTYGYRQRARYQVLKREREKAEEQKSE